jgi:hypothetical protein
MPRSICTTVPCAVIAVGLLIAGIAVATAQQSGRSLGMAALLCVAGVWFVREIRRD